MILKTFDEMKTTDINTYSDLILRINDLKWEVSIKEEKLKESFEILAKSVSPVEIARNSLQELADNPNAQTIVTVAGVKMAVNAITDKIFGKDNNFREIISTLVVQNIPIGYLNDKLAKLAALIRKLLPENQE